MDDSPVTMATFASQVELETAILAVRALVACKGYALLDQPLDRLVAVFDGEAYGVFTAQSAASHQRIGDMGFHGVGGVQDRSDSALSPIGGAIGQSPLLSTAMRRSDGRLSARVRPAAPLPMTSTSYRRTWFMSISAEKRTLVYRRDVAPK